MTQMIEEVEEKSIRGNRKEARESSELRASVTV